MGNSLSGVLFTLSSTAIIKKQQFMEIEIRKKGSLKKKRNDEEVYFLKHFQNQSILEFKTSLMDLEMDKLKAEDVNNGSKFSCMVILCMCSELDCDYHYWT